MKKFYLDALISQFEHEIKRFKAQKRDIKTFFIGGGTPSTVDAGFYEKLFERVKPYLRDNAEITIEANPNSASKNWLQNIKKIGVNRISFGIQSFNQEKLDFLGRKHTASQATSAVLNAYDAGIENISIDLINGVRMDTKKLLLNDLNIAATLPLSHISAYSLTIEKGTKFFLRPESKKDDEEMDKWFAQQIKNKGFERYEISNYAKNNKQSKHNLGYWKHKNYIGIGSGAIGFLNDKRFYTEKNIEKYIKYPLQTNTENLSKKDIIIEKIFLGFRSIVGVEKEILNKKNQEKADLLVNEKKIYLKNGRYYNSDFFLADEISLFFI